MTHTSFSFSEPLGTINVCCPLPLEVLRKEGSCCCKGGQEAASAAGAPLVADEEDKRRNAFLMKGLGLKTHSHINRETGRT